MKSSMSRPYAARVESASEASAERLGTLDRLSRKVRKRAAEVATDLPDQARLFVNVHPLDLLDPELADPAAPLSQVAHRIVLELTERASLSAQVPDLESRLKALWKLGYRLAIDDLGAGYSSLSVLADLRPDVAKIDMSLVRDIDSDPVNTQVWPANGCAPVWASSACQSTPASCSARITSRLFSCAKKAAT